MVYPLWERQSQLWGKNSHQTFGHTFEAPDNQPLILFSPPLLGVVVTSPSTALKSSFPASADHVKAPCFPKEGKQDLTVMLLGHSLLTSTFAPSPSPLSFSSRAEEWSRLF